MVFWSTLCIPRGLAQYSRTCIKRPSIKQSPSIKRSVVQVPKITSLITAILTSIKRSPLLSGCGHPLLSPDDPFLLSLYYIIIIIVETCIKRSLCKRKPLKYYSSSYNYKKSALRIEFFFHYCLKQPTIKQVSEAVNTAEQLRDSAQFNGHQELSLALSKVNDILSDL